MRYFGRVYELQVKTEGETLTWSGGFMGQNFAPLQITFLIDQTPAAERSYAEITVYGLNREHRKAIYESGKAVSLSAGYQGEFGRIFSGEVNNVEAGRETTDPYLSLFCMAGSGDWRKTKIAKTWGANTPMKEIIEEVASQFGYPVEFVGDFSGLGRALRGRTLARDAPSALRSLSKTYGFQWSLQDGTLYLFRNKDKRRNVPPVEYTPTTGLIGAPEVTEQGVDIEVLLNPFLRPWDTYTVKSETGALSYNAIYYQPREFPETNGESTNKIVSLKHEGDFYGDTWQTSLTGLRENA